MQEWILGFVAAGALFSGLVLVAAISWNARRPQHLGTWPRARLVCMRCGLYGHRYDDCPRRQGYPVDVE